MKIKNVMQGGFGKIPPALFFVGKLLERSFPTPFKNFPEPISIV